MRISKTRDLPVLSGWPTLFQTKRIGELTKKEDAESSPTFTYANLTCQQQSAKSANPKSYSTSARALAHYKHKVGDGLACQKGFLLSRDPGDATFRLKAGGQQEGGGDGGNSVLR